MIPITEQDTLNVVATFRGIAARAAQQAYMQPTAFKQFWQERT